YYELPDALAKLPLVCKQCGQRITPPTVSTALPPPPPVVPPPVAPTEPVTPSPQPPEPKPVEVVAPPPEPEDEDVLVTKADSTPAMDFNISGPTAQSLSEASRQRPAGLSSADQTRPDETAGGPSDAETPPNLKQLPKAASQPVRKPPAAIAQKRKLKPEP